MIYYICDYVVSGEVQVELGEVELRTINSKTPLLLLFHEVSSVRLSNCVRSGYFLVEDLKFGLKIDEVTSL